MDSSTCPTNAASGSAPRISTRSLTTVFGTPVTRYWRTRSGYSIAATADAVMCAFSRARRWARLTALGQCGQVGVANTWMSIGWSTAATSARLSSLNPESPEATSAIASTSDTSSWPSGAP